MKKSRFTEHQIVSILNEAETGVSVKDVCRKHGISPPTYYKWKSKYGGLIDRGPHARGVVRLVRSMAEAGSARCVLGNHEFNAIPYHTRDPRQPEQHLRPHTERNTDPRPLVTGPVR